LEPSDEDLNTLYDAALAFGPDWRRPLVELARERLPGRPAEYRDAIAQVIEACRTEVETYIDAEYHRLGEDWSRAAAKDADLWLIERYEWMTKKNRRHAISQGVYYAWHG
jgi:hypothetical protein